MMQSPIENKFFFVHLPVNHVAKWITPKPMVAEGYQKNDLNSFF